MNPEDSSPSVGNSPVGRKYIARHGAMRLLGEYESIEGEKFSRLERVIVKSERGLELAEILCNASPETISAIPDLMHGTIMRRLSAEDLQREEYLKQNHEKEFNEASDLIKSHKLAMQLVEVEHLFGGERIVFYFLSEKRIDFRELVKAMARQFQARIELRQIGVRDEAKLLADYGDCGKPVCCNTHLTVMPPVSMRMAKLQKSTLDPSKISGRCGRLKCCLRYENAVYEEFQQTLPALGARILTRKGQGKVLAHEILARRVLVEFEDGRRLPVAVDEILTRL